MLFGKNYVRTGVKGINKIKPQGSITEPQGSAINKKYQMHKQTPLKMLYEYHQNEAKKILAQMAAENIVSKIDSQITLKSDSKKKSLSEALVNSFGGYPIAYAMGIIILPLSVLWIQKDPWIANMVITLIYASVSFARTYFLRRYFEKKGIDSNFIRVIKNKILK